MAIYRGLSGVNREIKGQHRGLGGANREIKEQYRGVGGVNRLVFSGKRYLYNEGDECITLTGGWNGTTYGGGAFTKNTDNIYIKSYRATAYTTNSIDLTNYTKLEVTATVLGSNTSEVNIQQILVLPNKEMVNGAATATPLASLLANVNKTSSGVYTFTLDISNVNQVAYIAIHTRDGNSIARMNISSVKLIV